MLGPDSEQPVDGTTGFIPIKAARQYFVSQPTLETVKRWVETGFANLVIPGGPPIRLRAVREGNRTYTRLEWISQFKAALLSNRRKRKR